MSATTDPARPPVVRRIATSRALPWVVIVLAPVVGMLLLRAPLVNHLAYRDPWFYSGYGWSLPHHVEVFGWFYYGVRFTVILPIKWSTDLFGPLLGYAGLRALIMIGTGAILYACLRRFANVWVALSGVLLLGLNSFYVRAVLWDYTSFVALPATIAAVAVWYMGSTSGRRWWYFVAAGALFALAVFANALSGLVVISLLLVEAIAVLRSGLGELRRLVERCVAAVVGTLAVFAVGYLGYAASIGWFPPLELLQPTIDFLTNNDQLAAGLVQPVSDWIDGEPRIWGPPLLCAALIIVLGRRILSSTIEGRLAQFSLAFIAVTWLYRFVQTSSVVETWWAYNMVAVATAFAAPLVLNAAIDRGGVRAVLGGGLAGTALASVLIRSADQTAVDLFEDLLRDNVVGLVVMGFLGIALAVLVRTGRRPAVIGVAIALLFALIATVHLAPARWIGIEQTGEFAQYFDYELDGYTAAYDLVRMMEAEDQPDDRTLMFNVQGGLSMASWTELPHQGAAVQNPEVAIPLNQVSSSAATMLAYPTTRHVLVMSENRDDIGNASGAMEHAGFRPQLRRQGAWGDGKLHWGFFDLPERAPAKETSR